MFVKPAFSGVIVRDPQSKIPVPPGGREVPDVGPSASYWVRRVADGSLMKVITAT